MAISYNLGIQPKWYIVGLDGKPAAGANIYTYSSLDHQVQKPTYQDAAGAFVMPNPIPVDSNGTAPPIYWKFDSAAPTELYYVRIVDANGNQIYDFDSFTGAGAGGGGSITTATLTNNLIANNTMYRNIGTSVTPLPTFLKLAPGNHSGFAETDSHFGPDIVFKKNNTNAVDQITFTEFAMGDTPFDTDMTPWGYCNYTCNNSPAGETFKYFQFPIISNVRNLSDETASFSIWLRSNLGTPEVVLSLVQFFGDGTGADSPVFTEIDTIQLDSNWEQVKINNFTVPSVSAKTEGFCRNSGVFLILSMPLGDACDIDFSKPCAYPTDIIPDTDFVTNDQIDSVINSPRTGFVQINYLTSAFPGWILMNDGTIGNTSSSPSISLSNREVFPLYNQIYNSVDNTYAPVSGGRSGSAVDDFVANKTIQLTKVLGRVLAVSGSGSGLSTWAVGQTTGEEKHMQTEAELAAHHHVYSFRAGTVQSGSNTGGVWRDVIDQNTSTTGSSTPFNVMQPTAFTNVFIKL